MAWVPVESVFERSWTLLKRNAMIAVPGIAGALVHSVLWATLVRGFSFDGLLLFGIASIALFGITAVMMTAMSAAVWSRGTCRIFDAVHVFSGRRAGALFATIGAVGGVTLVALALSPFTLGVSLFAAVFFLLYTYAAAIVGEYDGTAALRESYVIARLRTGPTATLLALLVIAAIVTAFVTFLVGGIPFVGALIVPLLVQLTTAFFTLVVTGEYINLRGATRRS